MHGTARLRVRPGAQLRNNTDAVLHGQRFLVLSRDGVENRSRAPRGAGLARLASTIPRCRARNPPAKQDLKFQGGRPDHIRS